ncbi:MAG: YraN family protein [Brevundimonas sp.]|uniref:YraN family protein n=1 Tax=Brevundimonas sp. TaxID=1871086 RepID=UPI004033357B
MTAPRPATRLKAPKVARAKRGWRVRLGGASHRAGHRSEWLAAAWLMLRGYQILGFRLKTRAGEIDILARRGRTLAVVEVKRRANPEAATRALTPDQYDRLLSAGRAVLRQRPSLAGHVLRIDMVALAPGHFPRHRRGVVPWGWARDDA